MKRVCCTIPLFFLLLTTSSFLGCSSDGHGVKEIPCTDEELWDHVEETCVPKYRDFNEADAASDSGDGDGSAEVDEDASAGSDLGEADMQPIIEPGCDQDRDGVASIECGGRDCNDNDVLVSPNVPELCDLIDNDCDGVNNEALQCSFFAHSNDKIFLVDPFDLTLTEVSTDDNNLLDIDTHPDGPLLGVSHDGLYELDRLRNTWFFVGEFGIDVGDPNGFAIDSTGTAFVTSEDKIYTVDIIDGSATLLGDLGGNYYSSGDCVVNKRDSLYMTSKHDQATDWLLLVNRENASATEIGPIGFKRVFALTAAWGNLYGLTDAGELISIDTASGEGTLLHQFPNTRFFGAASTPSR